MDIRKRKLKGYVALSVLIIVCMLLASAMAFFMPNNRAEAAIDDTDLLLDDYGDEGITKAFNTKVFWKLISKISNGSVTDESGLSSLGATPVGSDVLRSYNNGQDIIVNIGGKQWIATYLSRTANGPILTFWLDHSTTTSTYGTASNTSNGWANQYTPNLYGTSYIRAVTLNIGGDYANTNSQMVQQYPQKAESEWAIYTMDKSKKSGSIKEFLEVPNNVSWQLDQKALDCVTSSAYTNTYRYNNNNDALNYGSTGTVALTGNYKTKLGANLDKYYTAWGTDTLWLPSIAEAGLSGVEGLWKLADSTRANTGQSVYSWLRSAASRAYYNASYAIHQSSGTLIDPYTYQTQGVRPAFHLNLAKAAGAVGISLPSYKKTADNKNIDTEYKT
ncbi:MAG: hypothetical protein HDT32_01940 [Clostridiales bacterium]|nr:hypothetical protein [Clostridiales bacterium]